MSDNAHCSNANSGYAYRSAHHWASSLFAALVLLRAITVPPFTAYRPAEFASSQHAAVLETKKNVQSIKK